MAILKFSYFLMCFGILLPKMLVYFKYRVNMHCCNHVGLNFPKNIDMNLDIMKIYLNMNVSSMEELHIFFECTNMQLNSNGISCSKYAPKNIVIYFFFFLIKACFTSVFHIIWWPKVKHDRLYRFFKRVLFFLGLGISLLRMLIILFFLFGSKDIRI